MDFLNACYAEAVQNFHGTRIKILLRGENYLIGHLLNDNTGVRSALISHIEFAWLERFCPQIIQTYSPSEMEPLYSGSVSMYLNRIFGIRHNGWSSEAKQDQI